MLNRFCLIALVLFSAAASAQETAAPAQPAPAAMNMKPLMIIRFNQPRVHFDHALYQAVRAATEAKPDVMFDVISLTPASQAENKAFANAAKMNLDKVMNTFQAMGVPASRVVAQAQPTNELGTQEIHILVR